MGQQTTIIATLMAVIFQNEENGYTVARVVTDEGELLTAVGCLPCAAPGEQLVATGTFTVHPQHGEQFVIDEVERLAGEAIASMAAGDIAPRPAHAGACQYCPILFCEGRQ